VLLSGHAGPPARVDALVGRLSGISGVSAVVKTVNPIDAVHCQPIDVAKPHVVANRAGSVGLAIEPAKAAFVGGDELRLKVGGADRAGYLYVDYYGTDGTVLHMLPRPGRHPTRLSAKDRVAIGEGAGTGQWSISAPYGLDLAVALVTAEPLSLPRRPEVEPTADYLPALKEALDRAAAASGKGTIAASLVVITTQPPRGR
jgi:hypothetical protein